MAPKERDLMYVGGAQGYVECSAEEQERWVYAAYGATDPPVDPIAIAYYRYERVVEDLAILGHQLMLTDEGGADRERSLCFLESNFPRGGTIDMAQNVYRSLA